MLHKYIYRLYRKNLISIYRSCLVNAICIGLIDDIACTAIKPFIGAYVSTAVFKHTQKFQSFLYI